MSSVELMIVKFFISKEFVVTKFVFLLLVKVELNNKDSTITITISNK